MPISLYYGRADGGRIARHRFKLFVILPLLGALAFVLCLHHHWLTDRFLIRYRQSLALAHTPSGAILHSDDVHFDILGPNRYQRKVPERWRRLVDAGLGVDEMPIYLGERRQPSGPNRLVVITCVPPEPWHTQPLIQLRAWVFEPGTMITPPRRIWKSPLVPAIAHGRFSLTLQPGRPLAGAANLILIDFEAADRAAAITGRLEADDTVTFLLPPNSLVPPSVTLPDARMWTWIAPGRQMGYWAKSDADLVTPELMRSLRPRIGDPTQPGHEFEPAFVPPPARGR